MMNTSIDFVSRDFDREVAADAVLHETVQRRPALWGRELEPHVISLACVELGGKLHVSRIGAIGPGDELPQRETFSADTPGARDCFGCVLRAAPA